MLNFAQRAIRQVFQLPYKDKQKRVAYAKTYGAGWYKRNRERVIEKNRLRKKKQREEWQAFKSTLECSFCGVSNPAVIDFHHIEASGDIKVSEHIRNSQFRKAYETINSGEVIPLCANCHRIHHYNYEREKP